MDIGFGNIKTQGVPKASISVHFQHIGQFTDYLEDVVGTLNFEELMQFEQILGKDSMSLQDADKVCARLCLKGVPQEWIVWLLLYIRPSISLEITFPTRVTSVYSQ